MAGYLNLIFFTGNLYDSVMFFNIFFSDIEYVYEDEDSFGAEIAELYSYTEGPEFHLAQNAFEETAASCNLPSTWSSMSLDKKCSLIQSLLERTEVASRYIFLY